MRRICISALLSASALSSPALADPLQVTFVPQIAAPVAMQQPVYVVQSQAPMVPPPGQQYYVYAPPQGYSQAPQGYVQAAPQGYAQPVQQIYVPQAQQNYAQPQPYPQPQPQRYAQPPQQAPAQPAPRGLAQAQSHRGAAPATTGSISKPRYAAAAAPQTYAAAAPASYAPPAPAYAAATQASYAAPPAPAYAAPAQASYAAPPAPPPPAPPSNAGGGFLEAIFGGPTIQAHVYQPMPQYQAEPAPQPTLVSAPPAYAPSSTTDMSNYPIDPRFERQVVDYPTGEPAGTIVIDTPDKFLYLVEGGGKALRYGIGVGKPGFTWAGVKTITAKKEWPDWRPPPEMLARRPDLPRFMPGGLDNPLGARAMYLGSTLYRIHGSNEPWTIGTNVSSGCIRMRNADVEDLYNRVKVGTKVVVM